MSASKPCAHPLCVRNRTFPADPTSWLGWLMRPNVDHLPERGTFRSGSSRPIPETWERSFCSRACLFAWIDARMPALAAAREGRAAS